MSEVLRVAIVGHANTGKTSLLRTLAREVGFGEVSDQAGTTRHVEGLRLMAGDRARVELWDTPGMEDAIALLERVDALTPPAARVDGPERIARFLATPEAGLRFEQESKVLRQMLASDAALYVIDVRDPVLPKYRDELELLAACARPLVPVLNFIAEAPARGQTWRSALARLGLHAVVGFDTVAPELDGDRRLFETLASLMHAHRPALEALIASRAADARARGEAGRRLVAELLLGLAALRIGVAATEGAPLQAALEGLRQRVRAREQACVDALLRLYRFRPGDVRAASLPLSGGRWEHDLFHPETLRRMGLELGSGMAAGAAAGVGLDLLSGGITLGAAAALGALAGGLWQTLGPQRERLLAALRGQRELTVDDAILRLVALRQLQLLAALEGRGHAAQAPIIVDDRISATTTTADADPLLRRWRSASLPAALQRARAHPEWADEGRQGSREQRVLELMAALG